MIEDESNDLKEQLIPKEEGGDEQDDLDMKQIFNNEYNNNQHKSEQYFKTHCKSVEYLGQIFRTDFKNGLSSNNKRDLEWREKKWGNNHLPPEKENSILAHII